MPLSTFVSGSRAAARFAIAALLFSAAAALSLRAGPVTVAENAPSSATANLAGQASAYAGFSFTTGASGPYDDLVLNLFSDSVSTTGYAVGTGFLLSSTYNGLVTSLSSSAPGYLASVAASGGKYTFAPSLTLQPNTTYYFYENGTMDSHIFSASATGESAWVGITRSNILRYWPAGTSNQYTFRLTGDVVSAVPEPSTWAALAGAAALAAAWTAKRAKKQA